MRLTPVDYKEFNDVPTIDSLDDLNLDTTELLKRSFIIEGDLLETVKNDLYTHWRKSLSGLYLMFNDDGKLFYLGKSVNIRNRLLTHLQGHNYPTKHLLDKIKYIKILLINLENSHLYSFENKFIKELKPMFNGASASHRSVSKMYGFQNLREDLDRIGNKEEIDNLIKNWKSCYIDKYNESCKLGKVKCVGKGEDNMNQLSNEKINPFLEAIKESIKLAVKHESEENADKIIYGFLSGLNSK